MDEADYAQRYNQLHDTMALAAQMANMPTGPAATTCVDCDQPIPEARRQAAPGCTRCIACQSDHERLGR